MISIITIFSCLAIFIIFLVHIMSMTSKKTQFILLFALLFVAACGHQTDPNSSETRSFESQLIKDVKYLSSDQLGGRESGSPGNDMAQRYIEQRFDSLGIEMFGNSYRQPFDQVITAVEGTADTVEAINVIGYVKGERYPDDYIAITAHYDHLGQDGDTIYNGADDNASGTGGLMAAAEYFSENRPDHSIIFIGFDAEEKGLAGARYFVNNPVVSKDQILININMDMISTNFENELYAVGTYHYPFLKPYIQDYTSDAPVNVLFGYDSNDWDQDWTLSSDHGPFHQEGIPFIYFGVEDHPHYHAPTDVFENINPEFYVKAVETIIDVIAQLDRDLDEIEEISGQER